MSRGWLALFALVACHAPSTAKHASPATFETLRIRVFDASGALANGAEVVVAAAEAPAGDEDAMIRTGADGVALARAPIGVPLRVSVVTDTAFASKLVEANQAVDLVLEPARRIVVGTVRPPMASARVRATYLADGSDDVVVERSIRPGGSFLLPAPEGSLVIEGFAPCAAALPTPVRSSRSIELTFAADLLCARPQRQLRLRDALATVAESDEGLVTSLRGRRVVALGESAHGSRELLRRRLDIARRVFSRTSEACLLLEVSPADARVIEDGVASTLRVANVDVDELRRFVEWARGETSAGHRIHVVGIDVPPASTADDDGLTRLASREHRLATAVLDALKDASCRDAAVLLAHDKHVSRDEHSPPSMGAILAGSLGRDYVPVAAFFGRGSILARRPADPRFLPVDLGAPDPGSLEGVLASMPGGDDRNAYRMDRLAPGAREVLDSIVRTRAVGAVYLSRQSSFGYERVGRAYDAILFEPAVQPARASR